MSDYLRHEEAQATPSLASIWMGLRAAAEELPWGTERKEMVRISRLLEEGKSLDVLNRENPSSTLVMAIRAGIESERFSHILKAYLGSNQIVRVLWQRVWLNLLYPFLMASAVLLLVGFFYLFNVRSFKRIYLDFGVELPWITNLLINLGEFGLDYWPGILASMSILLAIAFALFISRNHPVTMRIIYGLPLIGRAARMTSLAELAELLAIYVDARIPLPQAAKGLSQTLRNGITRNTMRSFAEKLESGQSAGEAVRQLRELSPEFAGIFDSHQTGADLAENLRTHSQAFSARAAASLAQFRFLIEPTLYLMMFVTISTLVVSLFLPLVRLLNDLS